jgi:NtrC-family two-component system response regulator AlgB
LRNAVERAVILSPSNVLELEDLGLEPGASGAASEADGAAPRGNRSATPALGENFSVAEIEREHIARVVARAPSLEAAAQILAIDSTTLQRKRKRYGLA